MSKLKKKNLAIKKHFIIGIHEVCQFKTTIITNNKVINPIIEPTHEVHYSALSMDNSQKDLDDPNKEIGLMIWFGAASAIQRNSNSKALIHEDNVYYILTWTDILGSGHNKATDLRKSRNNKMVQFLKLASVEHTKLILECAKNSVKI